MDMTILFVGFYEGSKITHLVVRLAKLIYIDSG